MILTCERCDTRFRLDEGRLPAGGARVRCSRCKHAFFVKPAGAPAADVVHQVAEAALTQARTPAPAPSWDLEEDTNVRTAPPPAKTRMPAASDALASDFEEESDWRFEDEMQLGDSGASLDLPNGEAPAPPAIPDPNESSFAELGDPESWDLLSSPAPAPPLARPVSPVRPAMPAPPPIELATAKAPVHEPSAGVREVVAPSRVVEAPAIVPAFELPPAARGGAWSALCVLVALAIWATLVPAAPPVASQFGVIPVGSLELRSVRARKIENAVAGPIWVVSGELRNPGDAPSALGTTVGVSLLDRAGASIEAAAATLHASFPKRRLREEDPARLLDEAEAAASGLASTVLPPGASVAVEAVFAAPAREAARFAVETRPARTSTRAVPNP